jgi:hypothetical protein
MSSAENADSDWIETVERLYAKGFTGDNDFIKLGKKEQHVKFLYNQIISSLWFIKNRSDISEEYINTSRKSWEANRMTKPIWLFYNTDYVINDSDVLNFVMKFGDSPLTSNDCALLFFTSFQDGNIQELSEALPLSMLYEIYAPIMESNFEKWLDDIT